MKKLLSFIIICCMILSFCPSSLAKEEGYNWILDDDGTLTYTSITYTHYYDPDNYKTAWPYTTENVKKVVLGNSIEIIMNNSFSSHTNLTEVTMSDNLKTIRGSAFGWCYSLKRIYISKNIETIYTSAFSNCSSLTDIYYGGSEADWDNINFVNEAFYHDGGDILKNATIHYNSTGLNDENIVDNNNNNNSGSFSDTPQQGQEPTNPDGTWGDQPKDPEQPEEKEELCKIYSVKTLSSGNKAKTPFEFVAEISTDIDYKELYFETETGYPIPASAFQNISTKVIDKNTVKVTFDLTISDAGTGSRTLTLYWKNIGGKKSNGESVTFNVTPDVINKLATPVVAINGENRDCKVDKDTKSVEISWNAIPNATEYNVWLWHYNNAEPIATLKNITSYKIDFNTYGINDYKSYAVAVEAVSDKIGFENSAYGGRNINLTARLNLIGLDNGNTLSAAASVTGACADITVDTDAANNQIAATSNANWLSVDVVGNVVKGTIKSENKSKERYAKVTVSVPGATETYTVIHKSGLKESTNKGYNIILDKKIDNTTPNDYRGVRKSSEKARVKIIEFEGVVKDSNNNHLMYDDDGKYANGWQQPTIGYGKYVGDSLLSTLSNGTYSRKEDLPVGGNIKAKPPVSITISETTANEYLNSEIEKREQYINSFLDKNNISLTQYEYDALLIWYYNCGGALNSDNSDFRLKKLLLSGERDELTVKEAFTTWCTDNGSVIEGLVARRLSEAYIFLYNDYSKGYEKTSETKYWFNVKKETAPNPSLYVNSNRELSPIFTNPKIETNVTDTSIKQDTNAQYIWPINTKNGFSSWRENGFVHDITASIGTEVYAITDGTIQCFQAYTNIGGTNYLTSYGNFIRFTSDDGKTEATYAHLDSFTKCDAIIPSNVTKSQSGSDNKYTLGTYDVSKGEVIGYSGETGYADGAHLHFELKINGKRVDVPNHINPSNTKVSVSGNINNTTPSTQYNRIYTYNTPLTTYTVYAPSSEYSVPMYTACDVNSDRVANCIASQECTILEFYDNDWCKVRCASGTGYVQIYKFILNYKHTEKGIDPYKKDIAVNGKIKVNKREGEPIDKWTVTKSEDSPLTVVADDGNAHQIIYKVTGKNEYKMGWVEHKIFENSSSQTPISDSANNYTKPETPTVFSQNDSRWKNYSFMERTEPSKAATISSGGCGILAVVNAVKYLTGNDIDPRQLGDFAIATGARKKGATKKQDVCQDYTSYTQESLQALDWPKLIEGNTKKSVISKRNNSGQIKDTYEEWSLNLNGVKASNEVTEKIPYELTGNYLGITHTNRDKVNFNTLRNDLVNGVAIISVDSSDGHIMCIADYRETSDEYLFLDSADGKFIGDTSGYAWRKVDETTGKIYWKNSEGIEKSTKIKVNSGYELLRKEG